MSAGKGSLTAPPRIIRVKRSAVDADLPIPSVLCHMEECAPVFYMLADEDLQTITTSTKQENEYMVANLLNNLQSDTVKRLRVEGIPQSSFESLSLNDDNSTNAKDFFLYVQRDTSMIDAEILEDPTAVGLVFFNDLLVDEASETDSDHLYDEEDSNAEEYYANDYPDEEDEPSQGDSSEENSYYGENSESEAYEYRISDDDD